MTEMLVHGWCEYALLPILWIIVCHLNIQTKFERT